MKKIQFRSWIGVGFIYLFSLNIALLVAAVLTGHSWIAISAIVLALFQFWLHDYFKNKQAILRNYSLVSVLKLIETFCSQMLAKYGSIGRAFNREQRMLIQCRARNIPTTLVMGTLTDPQLPGYECVRYANKPVKISQAALKISVGNFQCTAPYSLSVLNVGALSYGSLSKTAVLALSEGAKIGGFAVNTGEGGISPYHIRGGGDLIWQIGTGYFGCRYQDGSFNEDLFQKNATRPYVKMIELKLSQGGRLDYERVLPAPENTPEIAAIRNLKPAVTVCSPQKHTAFTNETEMMLFLAHLRRLSGGKPVGIKLCIAGKAEFERLCAVMQQTEIFVDFISIDGVDEGTEIGRTEVPLLEALVIARKTLTRFGIPAKIIACGKIVSEYDILRAIALGADACYTARGMMLALGSVYSLRYNNGKCPAVISALNNWLYRHSDVVDKRVRIANFHRNTLTATVKLMETCWCKNLSEIKPDNFLRRVSMPDVRTLKEIYFNDDSEIKANNRVFTYIN
ncbi:glutamate synthase-related protein [Rubrolithibacter danxiaensis]|uniref:glutamate synthase-related protein n=1 Tax=Rubrolithibacter danxiaensis TaxID=3390805 RepID=UPI003BF83B97